MALQSFSGSGEIFVADDVVTVEDSACLVTAQFHGNALRDAGANHVPHGGPPQIVHDDS